MGKRELVALLNLSFWCLVMVEWLFLAMPWGCVRFMIVVFPDHTYLLFLLYTICNHGPSELCFVDRPTLAGFYMINLFAYMWIAITLR